MKHLFVATLLAISCSLFSQEKSGYTITVEVKNFPDSTAYMSYYYGSGQYYRDTATINKKGKFVFHKEDSLEHGMYAIIQGKKKLFDFMVDNQEMSFKTDTVNPIMAMEVEGSEESKRFYEYLKFLNVRQRKVIELNKELKKLSEEEKVKIEYIRDKQNEIDLEVTSYIANLHQKNPGSLTSNFIKALEYPEVPKSSGNQDGSIDSNYAFLYFRAHYFDKFDFSDERLLRTSTYHDKMTYYLEKLTMQDPDSIIKAVDFILGKVENNPVLFKYTLSYLSSKYERSELMGMDAVFVHLVNNYYANRKADWIDENQLKKIVERANALEPLLIGKKAPNIIVKDTAMQRFIQLYDIKAKYTIVYIWSPECGHCKVATPKLKELYDKYRAKGVEVFGVGNEFENDKWIEFINKYNLDWINGSDGGDFTSNFRTLYDVHSTPQTYLLDENKEIISKKMSVESLENILIYIMDKEKNKMESNK